jgi:tetratricopeptide (TPR) repeat protein
LRTRPVFIVVLSPAAIASQWVEDKTRWAYNLMRKDPTRIMLPVLCAEVTEDDIWLFLQEFKRIEAHRLRPFPEDERIRRTLRALALTPLGETPVAMTPQPGESVDDLMTQGRALSSQGKHVAALAFFERATTLDPNHAIAWTGRSKILNDMKRHAEALKAAERALALDPTYVSAWINKSGALGELRRYDEALVAVERALALNPTYARALRLEARVLYMLGRQDDAEIAWQSALTLEPDYGDPVLGDASG